MLLEHQFKQETHQEMR